jgi:hypothetical protein
MADKKKSGKATEGEEAVGAAPVAAAPVEPKPATKSLKKGKLPPKNKSRLPRREKKARQKAAARA